MLETMDPGREPLHIPEGTRISAATARGLILVTPSPVTIGSLLEFELVLGARPLEIAARVETCVPEIVGGFTVTVEFAGMAQMDRDTLADFLQAVGPTALRVRRKPDVDR